MMDIWMALIVSIGTLATVGLIQFLDNLKERR